jgi:hypothetical protein
VQYIDGDEFAFGSLSTPPSSTEVPSQDHTPADSRSDTEEPILKTPIGDGLSSPPLAYTEPCRIGRPGACPL